MRNKFYLVLIFAGCFFYLTSSGFLLSAQTPQAINYQGVARDLNGNVLANQVIALQLSILIGSPLGQPVYAETHLRTTDAFGLFSLQIGQGTVTNGVFNSVPWGDNTFYLKVELDPAGGTAWQLVGTNQFVSVPYALYANQSKTLGMAGSNGQTLRYDGTKWKANSFLYNDSTKIGIGTSSPTALLHTKGMGNGDGNVLLEGSYKAYGTAPASGAGTRLMWFPDMAAFRAGEVTGNHWNTDSIGAFSVATGRSTIASGNFSHAGGYFTKASGENALAMGYYTNATGYTSIAMGWKSKATGDYSTAWGDQTIASGNWSSAMGSSTTASGTISTAMGTNTTASGNYSTATGSYTTAVSGYEITMGRYNTDYTPSSTSGWSAADRLLVVGNGTGSTAKSDAMVMLKNGNTGLGTSTPTALLHTNGTGTGGGNVLFVGSYKTVNTGPAPASGAGTRMMWYPDRAAFRVGYVDGLQWDTDSIGYRSIAFGINTKALGGGSTAMGYNTKASGPYSTAMGYFTIASDNYATAMGLSTKATGEKSTAIGNNTVASGITSTAMGYYTTAPSGYETAIGLYNTDYTPLSTTNINAADRLFVVGNGTGSTAKSDAMVLLKNGNTGLGTSTPTALLHTNGTGAGKGNVLFVGDYEGGSSAGAVPISGGGTRMMWYPDKAAFRAGTVTGLHWNKDSIGDHSIATGYNTKAKGDYSTAIGINTNASGYSSTAIGSGTDATGYSSTAMGTLTTASGGYSTAMGLNTTAPSGIETVIGRYNTDYTPLNTIGWDAADRLFVVGNGTSNSTKSDALIIYKNGNSVFNQNVVVKGNKGIIRSIDNVQRKILSTTVTVNTTITAGATVNISFTFPETFSATPMVYIANASGGGFAEVIMSLANITTTGGKIFIFNPKTISQSPNYTINIVAVGQE